MPVLMPPPPHNYSAHAPARPWSAKDAKAEAKAAQARLKALRPWYRKKRYILSIGIIAIIGFVAAQGSTDPAPTDPSAPAASGIDNGIGTADASADVTDAVLGPVDAIGFRAVTLTVTNNSSERSNYLIDLSIESPDGTTQYDTSAAFVNNLEPGQTRVTQSSPVTVDVPSDAVVTIKTISRLAAN